MGRANRTDQGIAGLFLEAFAIGCTNDKSKGSVLANQAAIRPLVNGELGFSHSTATRAWHRDERY
jgi:hypothetical protein